MDKSLEEQQAKITELGEQRSVLAETNKQMHHFMVECKKTVRKMHEDSKATLEAKMGG